MSPRLRKALGLIAMLVGLIVYAGAAAAIADHLPDHWLVNLVYFTVAGLLWIYPAARLVRWMQALDPY